MLEGNYGILWVCVCCLMSAANGECCASDDHGGDGVKPLSLVEHPYTVHTGMGWADHDIDCLRYIIHDLRERFPELDWPDVPGDHECDCEQNTFSTSQCGGCGSYLHGERHAMTLFGPKTD